MGNSIRMCAWGPPGCGKDITMLRRAISWNNRHPGPIYANFPVFLDGRDVRAIRDVDDILNVEENATVLLTELWHLANSHRSSSVANEILSTLLIRSRKKGWFVGYTQQHWRQADLRIRFITDIWANPRFVGPKIWVQYQKNDGEYAGQELFTAAKYYPLFDSYADPYTLDTKNLAAQWRAAKARGA